MVTVDTFDRNTDKDLKNKIITLVEGCPCYILLLFSLQIGVVNEFMFRSRCGKAFGQAEAPLSWKNYSNRYNAGASECFFL